MQSQPLGVLDACWQGLRLMPETCLAFPGRLCTPGSLRQAPGSLFVPARLSRCWKQRLEPTRPVFRTSRPGLGAGRWAGGRRGGPCMHLWWRLLSGGPLSTAFSLVSPACKADSPLPVGSGLSHLPTALLANSLAALFTQGQSSRCPEQTDARPVRSPCLCPL